MMFKILNGQTPDYLSNKFIFRNDTTNYRLRNSEMRLALPQPRTDYVRKSFSYSGAALWNSLPADIRVYFIHTEISHQISLCEKAFRILLPPIREAKRVSHT